MQPVRNERPGVGRCERREGMTLLEVTFSLALLTALALSVAQLVIPMASQSRLNREVSRANAEVRKVLEEIQATPFSDLLDDYPDGAEITIADLNDGKLKVTYEDAAADPLLIHLELTWTSQDHGPIQRSFVTARTE